MTAVDVNLVDDGLLWLVNRVVFHPRGFALGYDASAGRFQLLGDGSEEWSFDPDMEREKFIRVEALFAGVGESRAELGLANERLSQRARRAEDLAAELRRHNEALVRQVDSTSRGRRRVVTTPNAPSVQPPAHGKDDPEHVLADAYFRRAVDDAVRYGEVPEAIVYDSLQCAVQDGLALLEERFAIVARPQLEAWASRCREELVEHDVFVDEDGKCHGCPCRDSDAPASLGCLSAWRAAVTLAELTTVLS